MMPAIRLTCAALIALSIAACATTPPPPTAEYLGPPPGKRPLDAKTQLETGRRY
jgi:hypothetical protein